MREVTAYDFIEVYREFGLDPRTLGCVMLDTEPLTVSDVIRHKDVYVSPTRKFINGITSESEPHVTLLYGLLRAAQELRPYVELVLQGWEPAPVQILRVVAFESPLEPYYCLAAELAVSQSLIEAHARLSLLPHIDVFPAYRPHITLAYVRKAAPWREYAEKLTNRFASQIVKVGALTLT